ncbi:unnamed protein product [Closterium sp. Yama58-4]|nr:unnamed protein product [Closterium sp. Yama58-4]
MTAPSSNVSVSPRGLMTPTCLTERNNTRRASLRQQIKHILNLSPPTMNRRPSSSAFPDLPPLARGAPVPRHPSSTATEASKHLPLEANQIQVLDASPSSVPSISAAVAGRGTPTTASVAAIPATNPAAKEGAVAIQSDGSRTAENPSQLPNPRLPPQTSAAPWILPPHIADAQAGEVVRAAGNEGGEAGDAAAVAGKSVPMVPMVPILPEMPSCERWVRDALVAVRQYLTMPDGKKWPGSNRGTFDLSTRTRALRFHPRATLASLSPPPLAQPTSFPTPSLLLPSISPRPSLALASHLPPPIVPAFPLFPPPPSPLRVPPTALRAERQAMIMGGAIASACFNAGLRHPTNNHRSLIDFSIARLMQPMLLLGISIGVMCNVIFPPWLITVMLCVLLSFMTYKTLGKGIATWRKETRVNPALSRTSSVSSHTSRRSTTPGYRGPHSTTGGGRAEQQYRSNRHSRGDASPFSPLPNGHSHSSTLYKPPHSHHHHHHEAATLKPTMSLDSAFAARSFAAAPPPSALLSHASLHSYTSLDSETAHLPSRAFRLQYTHTYSIAPPMSLPQCQAQAPPAAAGGRRRWVMGGADAVAVVEMVLVWAFFLVVQVVKSSTPDCSMQYWLLTAAQVPVALFATLLTGWRARGRKLWWEPVDTSRAYLRLSAPSTPTAAHAARVPTHAAITTGAAAAAAAGAAVALSVPGSPVPPGTPRNVPPRYDFARELTYPLASLLAGCMGGLLGIGGGMVMGPVLLELNIPPQVTSATSTFIVVFSSSLSVVEFYLLGRIPLKVASYFCLLAMIAAVSGLSIVRSIVIRSGKASIIIFALASVIGSSAIVLGAIGGLHVLNDWKHGESMGFRPLCNQVW